MASSGGRVRTSRGYPGPTSEELASLVQQVIDAGSVVRAGLNALETAAPARAPEADPTRRSRAQNPKRSGGPTDAEPGRIALDHDLRNHVRELEDALKPWRPGRADPRVVEEPEAREEMDDEDAPPDRFLRQLDEIQTHLRRRTQAPRSPTDPRTERKRRS